MLKLKPVPDLVIWIRRWRAWLWETRIAKKVLFYVIREIWTPPSVLLIKPSNPLNEVVPVLESSVPDHKSYRRYLVQAHEYLASVYQVQGSVFEQQLDLNKAMEAYQKSIDQFEQCVKTGQGSPDLIIRDDILAKFCQPKLEKVRQIYNDLSGGN